MKIGIIGAMKEEIVFFQQSMKKLEEVKQGEKTFYRGFWHGHETVIGQCGVGKVNAAITSQMMIDKFEIEIIIFTGVAGGVEERLNIGDIVISTSCQQHDIDASPLGFARGIIPMFEGPSDFPADIELVEKAFEAGIETVEAGTNVLKGKVVSGDQFIADKKEVQQLKEVFSASCVEMEGAAVAQVAYFNRVPYVIIRSISDKANGEAAESFETFVEKAAKSSSVIVENLLKKL